METSYLVKKLVPEIVFYKVPGENRERTWKGTDARLKIPFDELENIMYDPATRYLFDNGYLFVENKDARVALGLELGSVEEVNDNKLVLDKAQIETLLYIESFKAFKEKVEKMGNGTTELLLHTAMNPDKQISIEKSDYIRSKFHIDIELIQREKRKEKEG